MEIKAKFKCNLILDTDFGNDYKRRDVVLNPVYGKEGENASYSKATPSGELKMQIDTSTIAYDFFKPGKNYYLSIIEVPNE